MADPAISALTWRIEFTHEAMRSTATALAQDISETGGIIAPPVYRPPRQATLGTPEVIITILATTAAKALILSGLNALGHALDRQAGTGDDKRIQIILTGDLHPARRFPINLRALGKDTLKEFIAEVAAAVKKL